MPSVTLSDQKQLIDLNQDKTLFDIEVIVTHKNPEESFQAVILNQTELDNGEVNYKTFTGQLKARLTNNKPVYQNYFLCVKGKGQVDYSIKLNPDPEPEKEKPMIPNIPQMVKAQKKESIFNMKTLLILAIVIGIGVGLYFMWTSSKTTIKKLETGSVGTSSPQLVNTCISTPVVTAPTVTAPVVTGPKIASPSLMNRLHKIASK
jgi:hypothetical protein